MGGNKMLNYVFVNEEEELFHVIRTRGTTYENYKDVVEKIHNINYTDSNDRSFLMEAVCQKRIDIAIDLLQRGIDVDLQNVNGQTASSLAVCWEQWEILEEILKYHPKVNIKDYIYGDNLLFEVVCCKNEVLRNKIAKKLLDMGANPYAKNKRGMSPLDLVMKDENEELIQAFLCVAKPLQEEEEKFRVPKKRSGIFPIRMRDYMKYICVEGGTVEYLKEKIEDYAMIAGGKKTKYAFKILQLEDRKWSVLCCPQKMDFYNYHNLMSWIVGFSEEEKKPDQTICVAINRNDTRLSYYGVMDKSKYGDRVVGRFQNGESFSIYLPDAYKKEGNAKSYSDVLPLKVISQYLEWCGLDELWLEKVDAMQGMEIEVEMAI